MRHSPPALSPPFNASRYTPVIRCSPAHAAARRWAKDAVGFAARCRVALALPRGAVWHSLTCVVREGPPLRANGDALPPRWEVYISVSLGAASAASSSPSSSSSSSADVALAPLRAALDNALGDRSQHGLGTLCARADVLATPGLLPFLAEPVLHSFAQGDAAAASAATRRVSLLSSSAIDEAERAARHDDAMRELRALAAPEPAAAADDNDAAHAARVGRLHDQLRGLLARVRNDTCSAPRRGEEGVRRPNLG